MSKVKRPIIVYRNGAPIGYIKSVSYSRQKFFITQNVNEAKGYTSVEHIQDEIDKLTAMGYHLGYIFGY